MKEKRSLYYGVAYYPEHWPEERWPEDIRLMKGANFTVVRMAEFAWSTLEPSAGEFRFKWLDRAIELLAEAGIDTVLGTPTAAPPAWLIQTYPDILPVDEQGRRVQFGNRRHYCVNSAEYHTAVGRIVEAMGQHFGKNPHVIGWQLDNEFSRICYCEHCHSSFQAYLQQRFGALDTLNERWTTPYWSQTYCDWTQIPMPMGRHNPGLVMAFKQFVTESYRKFQRLQIDHLRPHLAEDVWITHNFMKWFDRYDHYEMSKDLDVVSWDWYLGTGHLDYTASGASHDLVRGFKQKNFWLMETQPGNVNWSGVNNALNLGEARLMAWHAIAHGADAILYWQWRAALNGQEQYHGSLLDQSARTRPFYTEAQWLGGELDRVGPLLAGSTIRAKAAILNDYNSRWSIQANPHHKDFDYVEHLASYYRPLARLNIPTDIIAPGTDLSPYRLVIAPALIMVSPDCVDSIERFVKRGGYLILTNRTGVKDEFDALLPSRPPGPLAEIAGVEVEEYYALDKPVPVKANWFKGVARQWAERLKLVGKNGVVVARYGQANGWLDDQIAITVHPNGRGMVYYVGTYLDDKACFDMLKHMSRTALVRPPFEAPEGIEIGQRTREDRQEIYIIINHLLREQKISLPFAAYDHIGQTSVEGEMLLIPYGVAVLTKET